MADDMEILRAAYQRENDTRNRSDSRFPWHGSWEYYAVGASKKAIQHLMDEGFVKIAVKWDGGITKYQLTQKGKDFVAAQMLEREYTKVEYGSVIDAMSLVIGFDDIKEVIATSINQRKRINLLLEGPPACAKSVMLEAVRQAVPDAYIAFGSRTSAAGLSEALFERQPSVLLLDEADKMDNDTLSVLLGVMETGEILETKSRKSRGVKLDCTVLAACNSSKKFTAEFLSRFALHVHFPHYTRQEFIDVCRGFLSRAENCPPNVAQQIGQRIYDDQLGDVRKARGVWALMNEPTQEEMDRVLDMMRKYGPKPESKNKETEAGRLPGI